MNKVADFWDLFSSKFFIDKKLKKSQNARNTGCPAIAEVTVVRFLGPLVEPALSYGSRKFLLLILIL